MTTIEAANNLHAGCDHAYGICSVPSEPIDPEALSAARKRAADVLDLLAELDAQ